jgi:hypothetical protein
MMTPEEFQQYQDMKDVPDPVYDPAYHDAGPSFGNDDPTVTGELESGKRPRFGVSIGAGDIVMPAFTAVSEFSNRMGQGQNAGGAAIGAGITAGGELLGDKIGEKAVQAVGRIAGQKLAQVGAAKLGGAALGRVLGGAAGMLGGPVGAMAGSLIGGAIGNMAAGKVADAVTGANRQVDPNQVAINAGGRGLVRAYESLPSDFQVRAAQQAQDLFQQAKNMNFNS